MTGNFVGPVALLDQVFAVFVLDLDVDLVKETSSIGVIVAWCVFTALFQFLLLGQALLGAFLLPQVLLALFAPREGDWTLHLGFATFSHAEEVFSFGLQFHAEDLLQAKLGTVWKLNLGESDGLVWLDVFGLAFLGVSEEHVLVDLDGVLGVSGLESVVDAFLAFHPDGGVEEFVVVHLFQIDGFSSFLFNGLAVALDHVAVSKFNLDLAGNGFFGIDGKGELAVIHFLSVEQGEHGGEWSVLLVPFVQFSHGDWVLRRAVDADSHAGFPEEGVLLVVEWRSDDDMGIVPVVGWGGIEEVTVSKDWPCAEVEEFEVVFWGWFDFGFVFLLVEVSLDVDLDWNIDLPVLVESSGVLVVVEDGDDGQAGFQFLGYDDVVLGFQFEFPDVLDFASVGDAWLSVEADFAFPTQEGWSVKGVSVDGARFQWSGEEDVVTVDELVHLEPLLFQFMFDFLDQSGDGFIVEAQEGFDSSELVTDGTLKLLGLDVFDVQVVDLVVLLLLGWGDLAELEEVEEVINAGGDGFNVEDFLTESTEDSGEFSTDGLWDVTVHASDSF